MFWMAWSGDKSYGLEVSRLSASESIYMFPCVCTDVLLGAIHDPVACYMDVHGLHQGCLRGMRNHGALLMNNAKLDSVVLGHDVWKLSTSGGECVRARVIVNAAGAWADTVAGLCGVSALGKIGRAHV